MQQFAECTSRKLCVALVVRHIFICKYWLSPGIFITKVIILLFDCLYFLHASKYTYITVQKFPGIYLLLVILKVEPSTFTLLNWIFWEIVLH